MHTPHGCNFNRKRKADSDDDAAQPDIVVDSLLVDQQQQQAASTSASAPRQPWLAPGVIWASSSADTSPSILDGSPSKRPRHDKHVGLPRNIASRRAARRFPARIPPARPPPTDRYGSDVEDIGIVCESHPGPSTGSLLRLREPQKSIAPPSTPPPFVFLFNIEASEHHIPPLLPLISRASLKELDLDIILRNPQLRHDMLFDSGLQFRPTGSRRKRQLAEKYWNAVIIELDSGCTCMSFDSLNRPYTPTICVCSKIPIPAETPVSTIVDPAFGIATIRTPSRIRPLLTEFLEVLLAVLQPLASISGVYVNPASFKSQVREHRDQASHIRSIFDPALIEQELNHRVFDPSGLFHAIGTALKAHCAPIRDQAVEAMIQCAAACASDVQTSRSVPLKPLRQCLDILELMKLDIANHQIQSLQPYLKRSAGQWELKTFRTIRNNSSLTVTREWIWRAHSSMLSRSNLLTHPSYPEGLDHRKLNRNQQLYIATLRGLVDLVFMPPVHVSPSSLPSPSATPPTQLAAPLPGYPETFYLDNNRLVVLSADIADLTALHMFLLLYRQLLCGYGTTGVGTGTGPSRVDLTKLKNEIRDIGSSRLGHCFLLRQQNVDTESSASVKDEEKWRRIKHDIVLQVAMRAKEAQSSMKPSAACLPPISTSLPSSSPSTSVTPSPTSSRACSPPWSASPSRSPSPCPSPSSLPSCISSIGPVPDERTLTLAQKWADLNVQTASPLTTLLRNRLRDVVFNAVVAMSYPGRDGSVGKLGTSVFMELLGGEAAGLEPLAEDIRVLVEKISRLALVHLDAFLPLYEHPSFFEILA